MQRGFEYTENQIGHYNQQIQQQLDQVQHDVDFRVLTQLHLESLRVADRAYSLLSDAAVTLNTTGVAIRDAGRQQNRLIAEKRRTTDISKARQMEQEIGALVELRERLLLDKDQLKTERDHLSSEVTNLNARIIALKVAIRDRCGPQGRDWYNRLQERTERRSRRLGPGDEKRVRGTVKWYDPHRGFGFIKPDAGGKDVHVGKKNLSDIRTLERGDVVEFSIRQGAKGPWAYGITRVEYFDALSTPPDLTVLFDRVSAGEGTHRYRYRLLSYKRELNLWFEEFHTPETTATPQDVLEETIAHLNRMHSEAVDNETLFYERLNSIGTNLYSCLFPDDLKVLDWDKLRGEVKSIVIISYESWVPWELVRPFHPRTKQAEDGFLCEKFDLTRWLHGTAPPDTVSLERLGLVAAISDLELAASEAAEVKSLFGGRAEDISPSGEAVFQVPRPWLLVGQHPH